MADGRDVDHRRRDDLSGYLQGDGADAAAADGLWLRSWCNLPNSGAVEVLETLFQAGVANELFPLLLFIGIGAMIDFGPLLANPKLLLFGAAAQFGIFFTLSMASLFGFELRDAASIAIIGAADGPTSIFVANVLKSHYTAAIIVAAYSYMALVPIVQPLLHPPDYHEEGTHDPHGIHPRKDHENHAESCSRLW